MDYKDASVAEQRDVSASDQVQAQLHGAAPTEQQLPQLPAGAGPTGVPQMPAAAFWAPVSSSQQQQRAAIPGHGPLLSTLSLSGLVSPMELEAGVAAGAAVDPISTAGGLPGMWGGGSSRGTNPSSTTSSSGGRLQPRAERQAPEAVVQCTGAGTSATGARQHRLQQQQAQHGDLAYGGLSLPASPTMLQYQQAAANAAMRTAGFSNFSSPSSGSWPDVDLGSGSLLAGLNPLQQGTALSAEQEGTDSEILEGQQQGAGQARVRSDSRGSSGNDSGGEGDAGVLVPNSVPLLQQEQGVPLCLQLHMSAAVSAVQPQQKMQSSAETQRHAVGATAQGSQQQAAHETGAQASTKALRLAAHATGQVAQQHTAFGAGAQAGTAGGSSDKQQLLALRKQQQQHIDAQLMPPPAPPQHPAARNQSPSAAAAAAAAAADAATKASARPPPLVIPSTCATSGGTGSSSQPSAGAGQQLPHAQAQTYLPVQQQHQQPGSYLGRERPGSAPAPSPAYPPCSSTITPSMLAMGLTESHPALTAAGGVTGLHAGAAATSGAAAAAAAGAAGSWYPSDSSSGGKVPRRQRRPKSLPSSPAVAPAAAAAGGTAGEYSTTAGILASAMAAAAAAGTSPSAGAYAPTAAGAAGSAANTAGLSTVAAAVLASLGRVYIKVQCGVQFGWLDVRDSLIIVDVGTKKERKLTFAKFEALGGRGATRKWRTSIMALPDGPGDLVVPRTMPLGELLRKLNTDTRRIGQPGFGQDPPSTAQHDAVQQGGQISSAPATGGSQAASAAVGVAPSPEPHCSASTTPGAGLFSPGQRRPREESEDAADQQGLRSCSAEPYSRDDGVVGEEGGSSKRLRASQEGAAMVQHTGAMPGSQQGLTQQQQQAAAAAAGASLPWLTSPSGGASAAGAAAGMGLSISAGGPLQPGFCWNPPSQGTAHAGAPAGAAMLPPQPPPYQAMSQQQQQQMDALPLFKQPQQQQQQQQQQGYDQRSSQCRGSQGDTPAFQQQQQGYGQSMLPAYVQQQQQGYGVYDQEMPIVMHLTPPEQMVAAMQQQQPLLPGGSTGFTRQRRSAGSSGGGMVTPPSSQSPAVAPGPAAADASPMVVTTSQPLSGGAGRGRASSEDGRQQQQQQQQQVSSSGRPIRQQSRRSVSAAAAAAARLDSYDKDSGPVSYAGGIRFLQVWCDQLPGNLDLQRMMVIPQAGEREGQPMSLSQFEILGGRGSARKWRRSVSVEDEGQMISLGDWLEKYAEQPGYGPTVPSYSRYTSGSGKPRSSTASPGVAGAAAAAAAAAVGLPSAMSWQHMQRTGQQQQRDQGPVRPGSQGRRTPTQPLSGVMPGSYDLWGPQPQASQQPPLQQLLPGSVEKQGSPVLDDLLDPASQAAVMSDVHAGAQLKQQQQQQHGWGVLQGGRQPHVQYPQHTHLQHQGPGSYGPGMTRGAPSAPAGLGAAHTAATGAATGVLQQQQAAPTAAVAVAGGGDGGNGLPYVGDVLNNDFWHDIMNELAQDPVVDPHLHPAQVDVDMADSSRSPLTVNQQLLMLGSPPLGSTAAAAAAGAAAIMGFGPTHAGAAAAGMTAVFLHQQQQQQQPGQQQGAFPGSSVFRQQEQQK